MRKILSYILPFVVKVKSDYSGDVLISWVDGKKTLDTENANYSYGSLQRILETGISKIDLKNVKSILLLGLGGGSIIQSLREKFQYRKKIHAIEIDAKIIGIAHDEFQISANENLTIENADAFEFVETCKANFDLIIVDLFIDNTVPTNFYREEFGNNILRILSNSGSIIFNLGIDDLNIKERNRAVNFFQTNQNLKTTLLKNVDGSNTLLVIEKK